MDRVLVFAYFNKNVGDDLFVRRLQSNLRDKEITFLVTSGTDTQQLKEVFKCNIEVYSKVKEKIDTILYSRLGYMYFLKKIVNSYDKIIIIGGSMFIEYDGWERKYRFYKEIINNKTDIIGINFGPYHTTNFLHRYEELFSRSNVVSFRDMNSYCLFKKLKNKQCKPDIVFGIYEDKDITKKNILGISVIDVTTKKNIDYEKYLRILDKYIQDFSNMGYSIRIFSFCEKEGDFRVCKILKEKYDFLNIVSYDGYNLDEFIKKYKECKYVVATRFHAMILGWVFLSKVLPIAYSYKTINVISDISDGIKYIDLQNTNISDATPTSTEFSKLRKEKILELSVKSNEHFGK